MPLSNASSPPDSTPNFSTEQQLVCAVHQPNLLPRLSTLAKIAAADVWVVLDDVQFVRRDYQHRARIADAVAPDSWAWMSVETHLPKGRSTLIRHAVMTQPRKARQRIRHMLIHAYRRSPYWRDVESVVEAAGDAFTQDAGLAAVTEASTLALLSAIGWKGTVVRSSLLPARRHRNLRLLDLTTATHCGKYICGTGGLTYLDPSVFTSARIEVVRFAPPPQHTDLVWTHSRRISSVWALARLGPGRVADAIGHTAASLGLAAPL